MTDYVGHLFSEQNVRKRPLVSIQMHSVLLNVPPYIDRRISVALCILHFKSKLLSNQQWQCIVSSIRNSYSGHFFSNHFSNSTNFLGKQNSAKRGNPSDGKNLLSFQRLLAKVWEWTSPLERGTSATKATTPTRRTPTKPAPNLFICLSGRMLVPTGLRPLYILLLLTQSSLTSKESEEATCVGRCSLL